MSSIEKKLKAEVVRNGYKGHIDLVFFAKKVEQVKTGSSRICLAGYEIAKAGSIGEHSYHRLWTD